MFERIRLRRDAACFCCFGAMLEGEIAAYSEERSHVAHPWCWHTRLGILLDETQRPHQTDETIQRVHEERAYWASMFREARGVYHELRLDRPLARGDKRTLPPAQLYLHDVMEAS